MVEFPDRHELRVRIVREARSWLNTPYHPNAMVKGHGTDCAMLLKAVYEAAGAVREPIDVGWYSPQWWMHQEQELFLEEVQRHSDEIAESDVLPGDLALWRFGRVFAHGAILVGAGWPEIVHADGESRCVVLGDGRKGRLGGGRPVRFFTPKR